MTTKLKNLTLLAILAIVLSTFPTGCKTPTSETSFQNKAKAVAWVASTKALQDHPEWRDAFLSAQTDLEILAEAEQIGVIEVIAILQRMPIDELRDEDTVLYIGGAMLFFEDELTVVSLDNPPLLRAAVRGMIDGIGLALRATPAQ